MENFIVANKKGVKIVFEHISGFEDVDILFDDKILTTLTSEQSEKLAYFLLDSLNIRYETF